jgi:hypothetical protein
MSENVFTERAGRFLKSDEVKSFKEAHRQAKLACGQKDSEFTRSEFLGLDIIKKLLDLPGCVGLRVTYGERWEDENGKLTKSGQGQLKPRVLLTAVDGKGRDLPVPKRLEGGKDDENGDGEMVAGDGYTCPQHCPR